MNIFYDDRDDHYNLPGALMLCQPLVKWPGCSLPHPPKPAGYGWHLLLRVCWERGLTSVPSLSRLDSSYSLTVYLSCGLYGYLIYHLTLCPTLQEESTLNSTWLNQWIWPALPLLKALLMYSGSCLPAQNTLPSLWTRSSTTNASISLWIHVKNKILLEGERLLRNWKSVKNQLVPRATFWAGAGHLSWRGQLWSGHPRYQQPGTHSTSLQWQNFSSGHWWWEQFFF